MNKAILLEEIRSPAGKEEDFLQNRLRLGVDVLFSAVHLCLPIEKGKELLSQEYGIKVE